MFKKLILIILFSFFFQLNFAQQKSYLDSIQRLEQSIEPKTFANSILNIPFDKALTDLNRYKSLTDKAITIAKELNDSITLANAYHKLALALHFSSEEKKAITATLSAVRIFEKLEQTNKAGELFLDIGWRLKYRDLNKAIYYMRKGIKILKNYSNESLALSSGYNNYGVLLQHKSKLDSALFYHKKSLEICLLHKDSIGIPFAQTHIAQVLLKQHKFSNAKTILDEALKIREKRNDIYGITDTYLYLGDLYFAKKDFKNANYYFKKGHLLATKNNYFPLKKYATEYLFKTYDSLNDYKNSLLYFKKFKIIQDSILNIETNTQIAELEIEYQTEKKEKEINKQKLKIKNRNLIVVIISFALIIIIVISIGIYRRQQFKRKQLQREIHLKDALAKIQTQNRLQEQRLRISRDLHDNIGSQLTFIISSIDNLKYITKDANDKLKDKLTSISSFTSDTIFQLRDTIWAMNKSEITIEDLQTRIMSFIEKAKTASENIAYDINTNVNSKITFTSVNGIHIFRVIQEAINNSIKYANTTKVSVAIKENKNNISFSILDNGKGFDKNEVSLGNGLKNMEKRIEEIGGKLKISSSKEEGTKVSFNITK